MRIKSKGAQTFNVPNNPLGRLFIHLMKEYVNRNGWHYRCRGRGSRQEHGNKFDLPSVYSDWMAVYLRKEKQYTQQPPLPAAEDENPANKPPSLDMSLARNQWFKEGQPIDIGSEPIITLDNSGMDFEPGDRVRVGADGRAILAADHEAAFGFAVFSSAAYDPCVSVVRDVTPNSDDFVSAMGKAEQNSTELNVEEDDTIELDEEESAMLERALSRASDTFMWKYRDRAILDKLVSKLID